MSRVVCRATAARGRFVLEFHGIAEKKYPQLPAEAQPCLCAEDLRSILEWIGKRFAFLTPDEFLESAAPGVLLTFDDGFANNFTHALPLLEEYQAPAVFFVTTQHVADPKDWLPASRQQAELARQHWRDLPESVESHLWDGMSVEQLGRASQSQLVTIGSHTITHPSLVKCDEDELQQEVRTSKRFLGSKIGRQVDLFAYPRGHFNQRVQQAVAEAGYRAAFAEKPRPVRASTLEIPRVGIYRASPGYLRLKLSGFHQRPISLATI